MPGPSRAGLDRRGNWRDYRWVDSSSGSPPTRQQTRQANGVNEYTSIDPDGTPPLGTPPNSPPVSLQHDGAGILTVNPLAVNAGDTCGAGIPACTCGSGQQYEYDEENRVTAIKRVSASDIGPASHATATNLRMLRMSCSAVWRFARSKGRNDPWLWSLARMISLPN